MKLVSPFYFVFVFAALQACSLEKFSKIFYDDILREIHKNRVARAIAKAHKAPVYDQKLCRKSKICRFRTRLIKHLTSIPDKDSFDESLSEFPLFESEEVAVLEWELYLQSKGKFNHKRFKSGKKFINACPSMFLKYYYEEGTCDRNFYNRLFLNSYQRDILRGRADLAVKRARAEGVSEKLMDASHTSFIARRQVALIEKLRTLNDGETTTKEAVINPVFDDVDLAISSWYTYFSSVMMGSISATDNEKNWDYAQSMKSLEIKWKIADKFIRSCPAYFTKKYLPSNDPEAFKTIFGLHIREDPDTFEGEGELITFYDDFAVEHGVNAASVACDHEFGLARGSTFEKRSCHQDFLVPFENVSNNQPLTTPIRILNTQQFSSVQAEWTLYSRMVVNINGEIYEFGNQTLDPPLGEIINCSFGDIPDFQKGTTKTACLRLAKYRFLSLLLLNCAIVFSAGNESMDITGFSEYNEMIKSFANIDGAETFGLLNVVALDEDALTLSFSNQPGTDRALANATVCAPGYNIVVRNRDGRKTKASGSSFAAPFVSAMIAIIRSNLIRPVSCIICQSILKTATPIVMRRSRKRLFDIPVALVDVTASELVAGKTYHYIPFGKNKPKAILVDQYMIDEGRKRYGMGRVHLERALSMSIKEHGGKRKHKQTQT